MRCWGFLAAAEVLMKDLTELEEVVHSRELGSG